MPKNHERPFQAVCTIGEIAGLRADGRTKIHTLTPFRPPKRDGYSTCSFGLAQFSEGKNIVYDFTKMDASDNRKLLLDIKDNCDSLNFIIYGESIDCVILKDLFVNEQSFPITKMFYEGKSYNSKKINNNSLELSLIY